MENRELFDLVEVYLKAERRINEDTEGEGHDFWDITA